MRVNEYELESDVDIEGDDITAVVDADEAIGYAIWYTIGSDFVLPREWLQGRMEELELPEWMVPPKTTAKGAFTRTRDFLITPEFEEQDIGGRNVEFETKKATHDEWHLLANAYFTADELGPEADDGEWKQTTLGIMRYMKDHEAIATIPKVDKDDRMWGVWEQMADRARDLHDNMMESHIGRDIQKMLNRFVTSWTRTIKLRDGGAVYFVPASYEDKATAMKTLIEEMNQFKDRGEDVSLDRVPVINEDEQREMVEERARQHLEGEVQDALEAAIEDYKDDEETVVDEVVSVVEDNLEGTGDFVAEYNTLLDTRLDVREVLEARRDNVAGVKGDLIDSVLEELDAAEDEE